MKARLWIWWTVAALLLISAGVIVGSWPVTTRYGVDYQWSGKQIPLYEKAIDFLSRDLQARRLAKEVISGALNDQDKILKIFSWVGRNIRPTPKGFPVVDDHVWNVIIRGYGAPDQRTEAFALLASYSGFPTTAVTLRAPGTQSALIVALVQVKGEVWVLDVNNQFLFRNENGDLADLEDLVRDPRLIAAASGGLAAHGIPYERYFMGLNDLRVTFSRMEQQKIWPRLRSEIMRFLGTSVDRYAR